MSQTYNFGLFFLLSRTHTNREMVGRIGSVVWFNKIIILFVISFSFSASMLKLYNQFKLQTQVSKDTILARLNTPHSADLFALSMDAILSMVQKTVAYHVRGNRQPRDQKEKFFLKLEFYRYVDTQPRFYRNKGPEMVADVEMENLKKIGQTIELDPEFFHIYNILGLSDGFFGSSAVPFASSVKESSFWDWKMDQQMDTFLHVFSDSPWACSVILMSIICKFVPINSRTQLQICLSNTFSYCITTPENSKVIERAYQLYRIQGPLLVFFGLSGSSEFLEKCLTEMFDDVYLHNIQLMLIPTHKELPLPDWFDEEWRVVNEYPSLTQESKDSSSLWKLYTRLPDSEREKTPIVLNPESVEKGIALKMTIQMMPPVKK